MPSYTPATHNSSDLIAPTIAQIESYLQGTPLLPAHALSALDYGVVNDARQVYDAAMTSASATLTSATGIFRSSDVGKPIGVQGAGAAGVPLVTTISAYTSATSVTLAATASTTVSAKYAVWGTDNSTALQNAINAAYATGTDPVQPYHWKGCDVFLPPGAYMVNTVNLLAHVRLVGAGNGTVLVQKPGSSATAMITKDSVGGTFCGVCDLRIDGTYLLQTQAAGAGPHGIWFDSPFSSYSYPQREVFDPRDVIVSVFLNNIQGWGIRQTGQGAGFFDRIWGFQIRGNGIQLTFDIQASNLDFGVIGGCGLIGGDHTLGGGSIHVTNSKFWHCGNGDPSLTEVFTPNAGIVDANSTVTHGGGAGAYLTVADSVNLTNVEMQDCAGPGLNLDNCQNGTFVNILVDTCGAAAQGSAAFELSNSRNNYISGTARNRHVQTGVDGSSNPVYRNTNWACRYAVRERFSSYANMFHINDTRYNGPTPLPSQFQVVASAVNDGNAAGGAGSMAIINQQLGLQAVTYASSLTPNPYLGSTQTVTLTGNVSIAATPAANAHIGMEQTWIFTQDGTGGRTVTFDSSYKVSWTPNTTAGKVNTITLLCVGTNGNTNSNWVQVAAQTGL